MNQWETRTGNSHTYTRMGGNAGSGRWASPHPYRRNSVNADLLSTPLEYGIASPLGFDDVHCASEARVERVNRTQDLHRTLRISDRSLQQRGLVSAALAFGITWSCVPGCGHDRLVVLDLLVLDPDPMGKRATRRLVEPEALR